MAEYIRAPIEVDPTDLTEDAYEKLIELVPGWEPSDGQLDVWILQVSARMAAELREFASDVPDTVFKYFGESIMEITPELGVSAYFYTTWTAANDQGYTVPAGTTLGLRDHNGQLAGFQVVTDTDIPAGSTSVSNVLVTCTEVGTEFNDLSTDDVAVLDSLSWIDNVVGDAPTRGGVDDEDDDDYMNRLVAELRLMSPRPILPEDFAVLSTRIAGIGRAYPYNLYNLSTGTPNQEKCITLIVTDDNGNPASAQAKTDLDAYLQSVREVNFLVFVGDPNYMTIPVTCQFYAMPNYVASVAQQNVIDALTNYLNPKTWGQIPSADPDVPEYKPDTKVRYLEVAQIINEADGVDYIDTLTVNGGTVDVTLTTTTAKPICLPKPGVLTITGLPSIR